MRGLRRFQGILKVRRVASIERMRWPNNHHRGLIKPHYYRDSGPWWRRAIYTRVRVKSLDRQWWRMAAAQRRRQKILDEFRSQLKDLQGEANEVPSRSSSSHECGM